MSGIIVLRTNEQGHGLVCTWHENAKPGKKIRPTDLSRGEVVTIFPDVATAREHLGRAGVKDKHKARYELLPV